MAMNNISTAARNAMCDALVDLLDSGTFHIYSSGFTTELAILTFSATAFGGAGAVNAGEAVANSITDEDSALATDTAAVCRIKTSGAATVFEGTVGTSGADLNLNTTSIQAGDVVSITSMTVTMPGG